VQEFGCTGVVTIMLTRWGGQCSACFQVPNRDLCFQFPLLDGRVTVFNSYYVYHANTYSLARHKKSENSISGPFL